VSTWGINLGKKISFMLIIDLLALILQYNLSVEGTSDTVMLVSKKFQRAFRFAMKRSERVISTIILNAKLHGLHVVFYGSEYDGDLRPSVCGFADLYWWKIPPAVTVYVDAAKLWLYFDVTDYGHSSAISVYGNTGNFLGWSYWVHREMVRPQVGDNPDNFPMSAPWMWQE